MSWYGGSFISEMVKFANGNSRQNKKRKAIAFQIAPTFNIVYELEQNAIIIIIVITAVDKCKFIERAEFLFAIF